MITYIEHPDPGYPGRTWQNAGCDATIAFMLDINSPGEKLTRKYVKQQGKIYLPVLADSISITALTGIAGVLSLPPIKTVNIAGNALDTCLRINPKYVQPYINQIVYDALFYLVHNPDFENTRPTEIHSGGQSGFDEAGLNAAIELGIPAVCVCPKGWRFKNAEGRTICDEQAFKARFDGAIFRKQICN